jgi:hypothetical protein
VGAAAVGAALGVSIGAREVRVARRLPDGRIAQRQSPFSGRAGIMVALRAVTKVPPGTPCAPVQPVVLACDDRDLADAAREFFAATRHRSVRVVDPAAAQWAQLEEEGAEAPPAGNALILDVDGQMAVASVIDPATCAMVARARSEAATLVPFLERLRERLAVAGAAVGAVYLAGPSSQLLDIAADTTVIFSAPTHISERPECLVTLGALTLAERSMPSRPVQVAARTQQSRRARRVYFVAACAAAAVAVSAVLIGLSANKSPAPIADEQVQGFVPAAPESQAPASPLQSTRLPEAAPLDAPASQAGPAPTRAVGFPGPKVVAEPAPTAPSAAPLAVEPMLPEVEPTAEAPAEPEAAPGAPAPESPAAARVPDGGAGLESPPAPAVSAPELEEVELP